MKRVIAAGLAATVLGAAGCATTPEPCTSEWVHWKTERFVADFVKGHQKEFSNARNATAMFSGVGGIDTSGGIPMLILTAAGVASLASDFMNDLWPEFRDAVSECDTAPRAAQLFASILREQGVDDRAAKAIEDLGLLLDRRG